MLFGDYREPVISVYYRYVIVFPSLFNFRHFDWEVISSDKLAVFSFIFHRPMADSDKLSIDSIIARLLEGRLNVFLLTLESLFCCEKQCKPLYI